MAYTVFIVEDDPGIADAVSELARAWGLEPYAVRDFRHMMEEFQTVCPHIVLMDISLPYFDGYHWCGRIRQVSKVPVIFLSSADQSMNIVMAMSMGGDDFIPKPFDGSVLMAKINALLRRAYDYAGAAPVLTHRGAVLDTGDQSLCFGGQRIELTKNEYRILLSLMENRGKVVSRERLMERLWETDSFVDENTLTVNVNRLRKKLLAAGLDGFITTKFGVGYILDTEDRT